MFADDTHMTYSSNNINDINLYFNKDLLNVSEWLSANRLTLNQTKTEFMLIGSRQRISTFNSELALALKAAFHVAVRENTQLMYMHLFLNYSYLELE